MSQVSVGRESGVQSRRYSARFLGPFILLRDGQPFARETLGRESSCTLLKWFLLHPGVLIAGADLAGFLWPGRRSTTAHARLQATLHHVRHALEDDLGPREQSSFIHTNRAGHYWFELAGQWDIDLRRADRLFAAAREHEKSGANEEAIEAYERYLELCSPTFLPEDIYSDHFQDIRASHDVTVTDAQRSLLQLYMKSDLTHRALALALSVQHANAYSEVAAATIAEVHLRNSNHAAAVQHLERFVRMTETELGVPVNPRLRALLQRIRQNTNRSAGGRAFGR